MILYRCNKSCAPALGQQDKAPWRRLRKTRNSQWLTASEMFGSLHQKEEFKLGMLNWCVCCCLQFKEAVPVFSTRVPCVISSVSLLTLAPEPFCEQVREVRQQLTQSSSLCKEEFVSLRTDMVTIMESLSLSSLRAHQIRMDRLRPLTHRAHLLKICPPSTHTHTHTHTLTHSACVCGH